MSTAPAVDPLDPLRQAWRKQWPAALAAWSKYTRLSEPRWCFTTGEEKQEGLTSSFAMIRLTDQAVVISLQQVQERHLEDFAVPIMAHEIGHHVYCPANLLDHGRMLARMRKGLPSKESLAPLVANLYADLLLNDRLQRDAGLDMAGLYRALAGDERNQAWTFYMRLYEVLWSLPGGSLARGQRDDRLERDAVLGARLIRSYAREWLDGAGRFAALCLPYLEQDNGESLGRALAGWQDTQEAGEGIDDALPAGLAEVEEGEDEAPPHPADDPDLAGEGPGAGDPSDATGAPDQGPEEKPDEKPELTGQTAPPPKGRAEKGGSRRYREYRGVVEYGQLLKSLGSRLSDHELTMRYYRERAVPHLVPFPARPMPDVVEPLPEGLETWDVGQALEDADWLQTVLTSPYVIPGWTTVQRIHGEAPGGEPQRRPVDLYVGIDCSGSMPNPQIALSYPVLGGTILALSALRAGARVMAVLSGEPGRSVSTRGFVTDEHQVLDLLTGYLGTGYSFGIGRLRETFQDRKPADRPVHIVIVSDHDLFSMLEQGDGWQCAREMVARARGGGTYVLNMPADWESDTVARMRADGWEVHAVQNWEELIAFARAFSRATYGEDRRGRRRAPS
jgi:hypothetical protein